MFDQCLDLTDHCVDVVGCPGLKGGRQRIEFGHVLVESAAPVLLHIGDFGLTDGLATLQELAGLPSITPVSPVSFSLLFTRG